MVIISLLFVWLHLQKKKIFILMQLSTIFGKDMEKITQNVVVFIRRKNIFETETVELTENNFSSVLSIMPYYFFLSYLWLKIFTFAEGITS